MHRNSVIPESSGHQIELIKSLSPVVHRYRFLDFLHLMIRNDQK